MSEQNQNSSNQSEEEDCIEYPSASQTQVLQQKKFPLTSRDRQSRKVFDSADYFMEKEREQKQNGDVAEIPIPDYPHAKTPVLKFRKNQKKTFDSADYFMEQDKEHKKTQSTSPETKKSQESSPLEANSSNSQQIQSEEQSGPDASSIPEFPADKKPVLKNGRTMKKNFDSADYFMSQQKLKQLQSRVTGPVSSNH